MPEITQNQLIMVAIDRAVTQICLSRITSRSRGFSPPADRRRSRSEVQGQAASSANRNCSFYSWPLLRPHSALWCRTRQPDSMQDQPIKVHVNKTNECSLAVKIHCITHLCKPSINQLVQPQEKHSAVSGPLLGFEGRRLLSSRVCSKNTSSSSSTFTSSHTHTHTHAPIRGPNLLDVLT